ncbi:MAG: hypothetical protein Edafosvirus7_2 [Edafosvirus sp.]|uniref:Uncharacterized protein n=1 Tax=Edafosvirus sp. TaxID=2487765 RepID=A0A3G4ZTJ1_9VIRU|nr:MAG: hypothetical protein Edafosvirus7_2 [Edafosvirus sp.]
MVNPKCSNALSTACRYSITLVIIGICGTVFCALPYFLLDTNYISFGYEQAYEEPYYERNLNKYEYVGECTKIPPDAWKILLLCRHTFRSYPPKTNISCTTRYPPYVPDESVDQFDMGSDETCVYRFANMTSHTYVTIVRHHFIGSWGKSQVNYGPNFLCTGTIEQIDDCIKSQQKVLRKMWCDYQGCSYSISIPTEQIVFAVILVVLGISFLTCFIKNNFCSKSSPSELLLKSNENGPTGEPVMYSHNPLHSINATHSPSDYKQYNGSTPLLTTVSYV